MPKLKAAAGKLSDLLQRLGIPQPSAHRLSTPPPFSEPLPRPSHLPDLACFGPEPPPVTNWRQSQGYVRPAAKLNNPPPPTLKILSHNLEKKPPTPFIFHHPQKGYHILLLQELNEEPSVPHIFSHGGKKCKIFTNINKREKKKALPSWSLWLCGPTQSLFRARTTMDSCAWLKEPSRAAPPHSSPLATLPRPQLPGAPGLKSTCRVSLPHTLTMWWEVILTASAIPI